MSTQTMSGLREKLMAVYNSKKERTCHLGNFLPAPQERELEDLRVILSLVGAFNMLDHPFTEHTVAHLLIGLAKRLRNEDATLPKKEG